MIWIGRGVGAVAYAPRQAAFRAAGSEGGCVTFFVLKRASAPTSSVVATIIATKRVKR